MAVNRLRKGSVVSLSAQYLLAVLILLAMSVAVRAESVGPGNADDSAFLELVRERTGNIRLVASEVEQLGREVREEARLLDRRLDRAKDRYTALVLDRGGVGGRRSSPFEARALYERLHLLLDRLDQDMAPLDKLQTQLAMNRENLETALQEVQGLDKTSLDTGERKALSAYVHRVRNVERSLDELTGRIGRNLKTASSFKERLERKSDELESAIPGQWTRFFFSRSASVITVEFWRTLPQGVGSWGARLGEKVGEYRLVPLRDYADAVVLTIFLSGMLFVFGGWVRRSVNTRLRSIRGHRAGTAPLSGNGRYWLLFSLGVGLASVDLGNSRELLGDLWGPMHLAGSLLQAWGALGMVCAVRAHFSERADPRPLSSPTIRSLLVCFTLGLLLMGANISNAVISLVWGAIPGVFALRMRRARNRRKRTEKQPFFQRVLPGFYLLLSLLSFAGMGRFSIVLLVLVFVGMFTVMAASALSRLLRSMLDAPAHTRSMRLTKGVLLGISTPLTWTLTFVAAGFWLTAHLGGVFIMRRLVSMEMSLEGFSIRLISVFAMVVLFYVTRTGIAIFRDFVGDVGRRWNRSRRDSISSLQVLGEYGAWAVYIVVSLYILGISLTSLTVIAGGLSVGIGFGLQNIVNNFISGLILLFGRSIKEGDVLQFDDIWCTVRKINFRSTAVETFDSAVLIIPNSDLITNRILNWTQNNDTVRRDVLVGVAYGSDTVLVERTLLEVAQAHPHVMRDPAPSVLFSAFGASSLDFVLRVWIEDIDVVLSALSELRHNVDKAFREQDIEIAFPQMDLHFRSGTLPIHLENGRADCKEQSARQNYSGENPE